MFDRTIKKSIFISLVVGFTFPSSWVQEPVDRYLMIFGVIILTLYLVNRIDRAVTALETIAGINRNAPAAVKEQETVPNATPSEA